MATDTKVTGKVEQVPAIKQQQPSATVAKAVTPTVKPNGGGVSTTDAKFIEILKVKGNTVEAAREMKTNGVKSLRIKQVEQLTGLTAMYIRRKTQLGTFNKDYDEQGRALIPIDDIIKYMSTPRGTKGQHSFIVVLTDEEIKKFKSAFPDKTLKLRYDAEKAKAYRMKREAAKAAGGVKEGKLNLSKQ